MPEAEKSPSKINAQPTAIAVGAALLLGYFVITVYAIHEKMRRTSIEHVDAGYAVGDTTYFPKSFDISVPLVNYGGHSFYYAGYKDALDSMMARVGADDSGAYTVYRFTGAKPDEAGPFYLKAGPTRYVQIGRTPPPPPTATPSPGGSR